MTLFTEPSLYPWFQFYKFCKNTVKKLIGKPILPYSGHFAVMRSIITGLTENKTLFSYNPAIPKLSYQHVHVFANISALKMAIFLKRLKIIKYLSAGPNLVISSADEDGILASKYIDKVVLNSEWVKDAYLIDNCRLLAEKIVLWPAGIDEKYWDITKRKDPTKKNFLFYVKRPEKQLLEICENIAAKYGIVVTKIFQGKYTLSELKEALSETDCVVYFVEQESQGIALLEIWATDTPTFVWNPGIWHYNLKNYKCSSAPYLTHHTGSFFKDETDFELLVSEFYQNQKKFSPREHTVKKFSDLVTAKDFLIKVQAETRNFD